MNRRRRLLGAAAALLVAPRASAQSGNIKRLGVLSSLMPVPPMIMGPIVAALGKRGWSPERNLRIDARGVAGSWARGAAIAKELLALRPDVVLALSTGAAVAVRQVSVSIPIVTWCGYPVEAGLTTSLARPSANVTGVANYASTEVWGKFLHILREWRPGLREVAVLWDYLPPGFPDGLAPLDEIKTAATNAGIHLRLWTVREGSEVTERLSTIESKPVDAMLITCCGGVNNQPAAMTRLTEVMAQRRIPAITDLATGMFMSTGIVVAYTPHVPTVLDRLGYFIDRILRGAQPGQLPFEQPAKFELVINMKAARAHGFSVPQTLLARADRIIE